MNFIKISKFNYKKANIYTFQLFKLFVYAFKNFVIYSKNILIELKRE